jgi:glycine/D-amino acid oxidase-like deaminating enzyme
LLNPAALTRGLADSLPGNVTLYENSPVQEASFENGVHFKTANGSLRGPRLIMAANGFSEQFGYYRNRFLHLVAHCSLTRQLNEDERKAYGVEKPWVSPRRTHLLASPCVTQRITGSSSAMA